MGVFKDTVFLRKIRQGQLLLSSRKYIDKQVHTHKLHRLGVYGGYDDLTFMVAYGIRKLAIAKNHLR